MHLSDATKCIVVLNHEYSSTCHVSTQIPVSRQPENNFEVTSYVSSPSMLCGVSQYTVAIDCQSQDLSEPQLRHHLWVRRAKLGPWLRGIVLTSSEMTALKACKVAQRWRRHK